MESKDNTIKLILEKTGHQMPTFLARVILNDDKYDNPISGMLRALVDTGSERSYIFQHAITEMYTNHVPPQEYQYGPQRTVTGAFGSMQTSRTYGGHYLAIVDKHRVDKFSLVKFPFNILNTNSQARQEHDIIVGMDFISLFKQFSICKGEPNIINCEYDTVLLESRSIIIR